MYKVETTPTFEKEYKKLKKRYPNIDDDFDEFLFEIETHGELGSEISGVVKNGNKVFKKRMSNTSAKKGKSKGFRIIKYLITQDNTIFLLDIYSKSDRVNFPNREIRNLIRHNFGD